MLLEFAEPRTGSGVWDHSTYKADPIGVAAARSYLPQARPRPAL
ncbi:hypothetical protein [Sphingopyxis fribergensis]|nr:hypothetical protein [Sphingopyxis fribergensis]